MTWASQSGAAADSTSTSARTDSPASSSRFRSRTALITPVESVRCLPPAPTRPFSFNRASSRSSTFSSRWCSTTRERNSHSTVWSKPVSSRSNPSAYAHDSRSRTASAACRSVRFSAIWNTVTKANRPGDQPRGPLAPNADANSASANNSPNWSRTATGRGTSRP